jgi:hypothetical protein
MSTEQPGRPERTTTNASPMGSAVAIAIALAAVIAGFLILKNIRDTDGSDAGSGAGNTTTTVGSGTSSTLVPDTTVFVPQKTGTKVQVANAAGVAKAAGTLTTILESQGFDMAAATNGKADDLAVTKVLYVAADSNAQKVALTLASLIGVAEIEPAGATVDTEGGTLPAGTGVLVLLGKDKAGKTLEQIQGGGTTDTSTG